MKLSQADEAKLKGLHPDLVRVIKRAAMTPNVNFRVIEGMRTLERQRELVRKGASKTMNSRHLTGHAIDIAPIDDDGQVSWAWPLYYPLAKAVKEAARVEGVSIEWGGDWRSFKDGPHWQLPWSKYPDGASDFSASTAAPITEKSEKRVTVETVLSQAGSVASAAAPVVAGLAGLDWRLVGVLGLLGVLGFAAYTISERLRHSRESGL
jgi:peptidoglycan LD-endopeptidase CwlK